MSFEYNDGSNKKATAALTRPPEAAGRQLPKYAPPPGIASATKVAAAAALESRHTAASTPLEIVDTITPNPPEHDPLIGLDVDTAELVRRMVARKDALFQSQQVAPAPSQTYFQIVVYPEEVILRDWPRKRLNMPAPHPGQNAVTLKEFLDDGELQDQIRVIFGQDTLDECIRAARKGTKNPKNST